MAKSNKVLAAELKDAKATIKDLKASADVLSFPELSEEAPADEVAADAVARRNALRAGVNALAAACRAQMDAKVVLSGTQVAIIGK